VSLPEAVRKMTLLPATRLGLTRRGRIAPGFAADLVVFNPETVADTATFEAPHSYPMGIPHVAVNGVLVIENGAFTGQTPGKVIRGFDD
jgi:N-acyl-D-amino-acid deacylase